MSRKLPLIPWVQDTSLEISFNVILKFCSTQKGHILGKDVSGPGGAHRSVNLSLPLPLVPTGCVIRNLLTPA